MTKKQKTALFLELLPVALAVFVPLIEAKLKQMLTPPPLVPSDSSRIKWYVLAALVCYAAFIAVTVLFVKLAWRWVL